MKKRYKIASTLWFRKNKKLFIYTFTLLMFFFLFLLFFVSYTSGFYTSVGMIFLFIPIVFLFFLVIFFTDYAFLMLRVLTSNKISKIVFLLCVSLMLIYNFIVLY